MSEWTEVRYNKRRGLFHSPRGRPQYPREEEWQYPRSRERYEPSPPRGRRPDTPPRNHLQYGARRADPPPRTWRPPSPFTYRRPSLWSRERDYLYPPRERPTYYSPPRARRPRSPRGFRRPPSPSRDYRPNLRSRGRDRWRPEGRMDRASPLRYRRDYPQKLSWPVPPPRAPQRNDPRINTRSYADVTRGPDRDQDGHEIKRIPADPELKELVTDLYAFIKAIHHLHNVSSIDEGPAPRTISRMVDTLSTMIKPAAPTPTTRLMIEGAAREWGHTVCTILKQHYEDGIETRLEGLSGLLTDDWRDAFKIATRWAHRNLPRLTGETIAAAEAQLTAKAEEEMDPIPSSETRPPPSRPRPQPGQAQTPATSTRRRETQAAPPMEKRGPRRARNAPRDQPPEDASGPPDPQHQLTEETPGPSAPSSLNHAPTTLVNRGTPSLLTDSSDSEDLSDGEHTEDNQPGPHQTYRVTEHPHTLRKLTDWELKVNKKWLIIGDSNLTRIPNHNHPDLQIDSFPGAHFRHAQTLLEKTIPVEGVTVDKIILAFGINSRTNKSRETTFKNVQAAIRAADRSFPEAEIYIQQVNFNKALPLEERDNLMTLNALMADTMHTIPLLPGKLFSTLSDNIHWTPATGKAFLDHWMATLNPVSP